MNAFTPIVHTKSIDNTANYRDFIKQYLKGRLENALFRKCVRLRTRVRPFENEGDWG